MTTAGVDSGQLVAYFRHGQMIVEAESASSGTGPNVLSRPQHMQYAVKRLMQTGCDDARRDQLDGIWWLS
jgi:hypothetical protein